MGTPKFHSNYPGSDLATLAAQFVLDRVGREKLAEAVLLLPSRRASLAMREAFRAIAGEATLLLPRMISLADVGDELLTLLGHEALPILQSIPPAMNSARRHYLLTAQVMQFEQARGGDTRIEHAMRLADYLADLQDRCIRAGIVLDADKFKELFPRDYAQHWQQSLLFLNIVGETWPQIESEEGQVSPATHEVQLLQALRNAWESKAPNYPVFAIGSTASQPATAALLSTIARIERGHVILPGLDTRIAPDAWEAVHESHPYFYLKQLLDSNDVQPKEVSMLGEPPEHCSIWLEVLCRVEAMDHWRTKKLDATRFDRLKLISCQHAEEEARVVTLLMREGLEDSTAKIALITPDESLMARVAIQLQHYGLIANRLSQGTLAGTETGSLLAALMEAVASPESVRALVQLLRHPLVMLGEEDQWPGWLDMFERAGRGIRQHAIGQLPSMDAVLRETKAYAQVQRIARELADLSRARIVASEWVARLQALLAKLAPVAGQAQEKIAEALDQCAGADLLGKLGRQAFSGLLSEALETNWRGPQFGAHPQLTMLTPVEARLQRFDRVIFGNMVERLWPGMHGQSPWLNLAQQQELGLPGAEQHSTLIAHDILMHGSAGEVFLTYPLREASAPVARSRYIERLLALAEAQGLVPDALMNTEYAALAEARYAIPFTPEQAPYPRPSQPLERLRVTELDKAITDPFSIYARAILGLRPLDELDAEPEPRDFGTVAHEALRKLAEFWTEHRQAPDATTLQAMVDDALSAFADRPAVQLFWRRRLLRAMAFVNDKELLRRGAVSPELPVEQAIHTPHGILTLQGKIDRLEGRTIVDYKTGKPPSVKEVEQGRALQLLAYAAMLAARGEAVEAIEYWGLPSGKRAEKIEALAWTPEVAAELTAKLNGLLAELMDPQTAFLARPISTNERFDNDYDGISRYDEWAG